MGADLNLRGVELGQVADDQQRVQLDHGAAGLTGGEVGADLGVALVEHAIERRANAHLFHAELGLAHVGRGRIEIGLVLQHLGL